mgnify:CR=1 FL=1
MKKKIVKPEFIVDVMDVEDPFEVEVKFAEAKQKAGKPLTDRELDAIVTDRVEQNSYIMVVHETCDCKKCKKLPWYKRFWNWITRKK